MGYAAQLERRYSGLMNRLERDLDRGTLLSNINRGKHVDEAHLSQSWEQIIARVFDEDKPGSTFSGKEEAERAVGHLVLHDGSARRRFLSGLDSSVDEGRWKISGRVPGLSASCARQSGGFLQIGQTDYVQAVFARNSRIEPYGIALVTAYPDANHMVQTKDAAIRQLSLDIARGSAAYQEGTDAKRLWMELACVPTDGLTYLRYNPNSDTLLAEVLGDGGFWRVTARKGGLFAQPFSEKGGGRIGAPAGPAVSALESSDIRNLSSHYGDIAPIGEIAARRMRIAQVRGRERQGTERGDLGGASLAHEQGSPALFTELPAREMRARRAGRSR